MIYLFAAMYIIVATFFLVKICNLISKDESLMIVSKTNYLYTNICALTLLITSYLWPITGIFAYTLTYFWIFKEKKLKGSMIEDMKDM